MQEIIKAQGGNPDIDPDKLRLGTYTYTYKASKSGILKDTNNIVIAKNKFFSDVAESPEFFTTAKKVVTDERIKILNENEDHIDTFNIYDDV